MEFMFMYYALLVILVVVLGIAGVLFYHHQHTPRKFNSAPRTSGEVVTDDTDDDWDEDEDEADDVPGDDEFVDPGIVRANNEIFDAWEPFQELLKDAGVVDVIDGMLEYDVGDGAKTFVGIAEMEQSNPFLKTSYEKALEDVHSQLFLSGLSGHTKISLQWSLTDMRAYFKQAHQRIDQDEQESQNLKELGHEVLKQAEEFEHAGERFENRVYVQFIVKVQDDDIIEAETADDVIKEVYANANQQLDSAIMAANAFLANRHHKLTRLYTYDLLALFYRTFNRHTARSHPFEKLVSNQNFNLFTTASETDKKIDDIDRMVQLEQQMRTLIDHDPRMQELQQKMQTLRKAYLTRRHQLATQVSRELDQSRKAKLRDELHQQEAQVAAEHDTTTEEDE